MHFIGHGVCDNVAWGQGLEWNEELDCLLQCSVSLETWGMETWGMEE